MISYKSLVEFLLALANSHPLIQSAVWEVAPDKGTGEGIRYPHFILEFPMNPRVIEAGMVLTLGLEFLDRPDEGPANILPILSKMQRVAQEYIQALMTYEDLEVARTYNMFEVTNEYADRVSGWRVEVEVSINAGHKCANMMTDLPPLDLDFDSTDTGLDVFIDGGTV